MYLKLAARNVKRQMGNYLIYFMTVALTVALLFAINNIICSSNLAVFVDRGESAREALQVMVAAISSIVAFVLSYATSFLLKRRKREFGMYLTLGMTRRDILTVFLMETFVIGSIALGTGLVAGALFFQGMMAVMMKLLEMEFAIAPYSARGAFRTVVLTAGIFLLASAVSGIYLWRASIYDLIHGEKRMEKGTERPLAWVFVTIVSFAAMAACSILFWRDMERAILQGHRIDGMGYLLAGFLLSVALLHIGAAKSMVFLLLGRHGFCSCGANTFVLRQLSGNLNANALMLGCLAMLMSLAVVGTNFSFIQKASREEALYNEYPYDIMYHSDKCHGEEGGIPLEEAEKLIEEYAGIGQKPAWRIYESGRQDFYSRTEWYEEGMAPNDSFMSLSDFNRAMAPLEVESISLQGQFMIVSNQPGAASADWSDMVWEQGGQEYTFHSFRSDYPKISYRYLYVVVPDEAVAGLECVEESRAYMTIRNRFDGIGLHQALAELFATEGEMGEFEIREYRRQEENDISSILVVGALFASGVFLLLAMAILALKTLSALEEDKLRYGILFRLGLGEKEQAKALFRQTFPFFLLPFALPMAMSIPVAAFGTHLMRVGGMEASADLAPLIAGIVAAVMALSYLLYYTASYLIAKRAVVRE